MVFKRNVPQTEVPVKPVRILPTLDSKIGKIIAYYNRDGQQTFGKIEHWQFDMAGILSYEVRTADGMRDFVSRWNFAGEVVLQ